MALLALMVASAVIAVAVGLAERRVRVPHGVRRAYAALLAGLALAVLGGFVMAQDGPGPLVDRAYDGVNQDKLPASQAEVNNLKQPAGQHRQHPARELLARRLGPARGASLDRRGGGNL